MIHYSNFPMKPLKGAFNHDFKDKDGNGFTDMLTLTGTYDFSLAGDYRIQGWIYESDSGNYRDNFERDYFINQGATLDNIYLEFVSWYLNTGVAESYNITLRIKQRDYPHFTLIYINNFYTTPVIDFTTWDSDPLEFIDFIVTEAVDDDQNGLYDYYDVVTIINVRWGGWFHTDISFNVNDTWHLYGVGTFFEFFTGNNTISWHIPSSIFAIEHSTNSYRIDINLQYAVSQWWDHIDGSSYYNASQIYSFSEWQLGAAFVFSNFADYGEDTDEDGLYNSLILETVVEVGTPGMYQVGGDINVLMDPDWGIDSQSQNLNFDSPGTYSFILRFDKNRLLKHGWNESLIMSHLYLEQYDPTEDNWDR
ncbi:MAG: hypothetical protein ACXAC7_23705, partial [Candidatus Hodarchaeales archaeon]